MNQLFKGVAFFTALAVTGAQVAVHLPDFTRTGLHMQPVYILRHQPLQKAHLFHPRQGIMSFMRFGQGNAGETVERRLVKEAGIVLQNLHRGSLDRVDLLPDPRSRSPEIGNAAFRGEPGPGQTVEPAALFDQSGGLLDLILVIHF